MVSVRSFTLLIPLVLSGSWKRDYISIERITISKSKAITLPSFYNLTVEMSSRQFGG